MPCSQLARPGCSASASMVTLLLFCRRPIYGRPAQQASVTLTATKSPCFGRARSRRRQTPSVGQPQAEADGVGENPRSWLMPASTREPRLPFRSTDGRSMPTPKPSPVLAASANTGSRLASTGSMVRPLSLRWSKLRRQSPSGNVSGQVERKRLSPSLSDERPDRFVSPSAVLQCFLAHLC